MATPKKKNILTQTKITKPRNQKVDFMNEVAMDIIGLRFEPTDSLNACKEKFYIIMQKHGIKQGTARRDENGKVMSTAKANFEWTMCQRLFLDTLSSHLNMEMLFSTPKGLEHY